MDKITVTGFPLGPAVRPGACPRFARALGAGGGRTSYEVGLIDVDDRTSDAYREKHPFAMVLAFEADGIELFESGAILHLIAEESEALMPSNRRGRAKTLTWMFAALNTVEPPVNNLSSLGRSTRKTS